jgi:uncharacterized membrane protein
MKTTKSAVLASAVAALFAATAFADDKAPMKDGKAAAEVKCQGVNSCKGSGSCSGGDHGCAGKNGCKGQGWTKLTEKDCKAKGGVVLADAKK